MGEVKGKKDRMYTRGFIWFLCFLVSFLCESACWAQQKEEKRLNFEDRRMLRDHHYLVEEYDRVVKEWDLMAEDLSDYRGLSVYCTDREYKADVMYILNTIHHMDTLIYGILTERAKEHSNRELRVTLKEIDKLENKYKPLNFIRKLNDDCRGRRELERDYKKLRNDLNLESYDGKALIIENDASAYVHHIKRLTDLVDKHIHHLLDE